jgi:hypothetical protein
MTKFFITDGRQSQVVARLSKRRKQLAMTKQRTIDKMLKTIYCYIANLDNFMKSNE